MTLTSRFVRWWREHFWPRRRKPYGLCALCEEPATRIHVKRYVLRAGEAPLYSENTVYCDRHFPFTRPKDWSELLEWIAWYAAACMDVPEFHLNEKGPPRAGGGPSRSPSGSD